MAANNESILSTLASLFFPASCVHCGRPGTRLCSECEELLAAIAPQSCRRCGKPTLYDVPDCRECRARRLHFKSAAAAFAYQGPARSLVHALKYTGQRRLADLMAELTLKPRSRAAGLTDIFKAATLTYVPLYKPKQSSRGYNQARLYARALARRLDLPCRALLEKHRPTPPQNRLNFSQRRNNLVGCFSIRDTGHGRSQAGNRKRRGRSGKGLASRLHGYQNDCQDIIHGGPVILVDDVYTTGSTASECARVLREGLAVEVLVWTFARTVRIS